MTTACSDATAPETVTESLVGVYLLTTLNNLPMPVPLGDFYGYTLEYTSSRMSFSTDSSYHERSIVTERVDGRVVQVDTVDAFGLWRQAATRVVLRDAAATDSLVGKIDKGVLTFDVMVEDSMFHYLYKRQ